jgi:hypothetical protein
MKLDRQLRKKSIEFSLALLLMMSGTRALARTMTPEEVANTIYQQIPNLPREDGYLDRESQTAAKQNTLISRLVRYHQNVKSRPTGFRLDWQLTFADYFGINETIQENRYPGSSTLTVNPLEGDRQAIRKLTRQQRRQSIELLVSIYNNLEQKNSTPTSGTEQTPPDSINNQPERILPRSGDANLLK